MFHKIQKKLKERKGASTYIELSVLIIVFVMLFVFVLSLLSVYSKYNLVNTIAHETARYVEIKGKVDGDTYAEVERLKRATNFKNVEVTFSRTGRLSLEEEFTVVVVVTEKIGIGGLQVIPVRIKAVATGRSEVYWK